jgi:hypothetical protein
MTWSEWFTFDIFTGQELLILRLANRDIYGTFDVIGECEIPLDHLRDQMKHDEWYALSPPINSPSNQLFDAGKEINIHLVLQWIHCHEKYFEMGIKRLEEALG